MAAAQGGQSSGRLAADRNSQAVRGPGEREGICGDQAAGHGAGASHAPARSGQIPSGGQAVQPAAELRSTLAGHHDQGSFGHAGRGSRRLLPGDRGGRGRLGEPFPTGSADDRRAGRFQSCGRGGGGLGRGAEQLGRYSACGHGGSRDGPSLGQRLGQDRLRADWQSGQGADSGF